MLYHIVSYCNYLFLRIGFHGNDQNQHRACRPLVHRHAHTAFRGRAGLPHEVLRADVRGKNAQPKGWQGLEYAVLGLLGKIVALEVWL